MQKQPAAVYKTIFLGGTSSLKPSVMLNVKRQSVSSAGLCIPPWRRLRVEHGAARVVRAGGGVEGPERRRHPALPRLHVRELVLRVREKTKQPSRVSQSRVSANLHHLLRTRLYPSMYCRVFFVIL